LPDGRFLSKSIAYSAQVGAVSLEADYLFMRMIPHLDSSGRMIGEPASVKALCCPLRAELSPEIVAACLEELHNSGLVRWYEVAGQRYTEFPGFTAHQRGARLDREGPSRLPPPPKVKREQLRRTPENSGERRVSEVKRSEVKQREEKLVAPEPARPPKDSWLLPASRIWEARFGAGTFPWGEFGKNCKALKPHHAPATIADHLKRFLDVTPAEFAIPSKFAKTFGQWAPIDSGALVDEFGCMTELGDKETRSLRRVS
jgi:hypothetical protein